MNLYLKIKDLLTADRTCRNSYSELRWRIWEDEGSVTDNAMTKSQYLKATDAETIRRTAQKVVEAHPELKADASVREKREELEKTGGNFVFRTNKQHFNERQIKDTMTVLTMKWNKVPKEERVGEEYEKDRAIYKKYEAMLLEDPVTKFEHELGIDI